MASTNTYTFRKLLGIAVWILLASGIVVLLVAAVTRKNNEVIRGVEISISGVQNNYFIDKKEVTKILEKTAGKSFKDQPASALDLTSLEVALQKNVWIKRAELFFDNNDVLQVKVIEREPVARIFTMSGASFYIDSALKRLPLSDKFSPRLPMFTSFPTDVLVLKKKDSLVLQNIKTMAQFINKDPFWLAQIDQIDVLPEGDFDLVPKLGNQLIHFGNIENYEQKFNKLLAFYKQVQTKTGWSRYSVIDLQFKNQVVAVNRDAKEIKMDSLKAVEIMKNIIEEAQKSASDSTSVQLEQPVERNTINASVEKEIIPEQNNNHVTEERPVSGSVAPVHIPEKPIEKNPATMAKPSVSQPSSFEKPNPAQRKKKAEIKPKVKKQVIKNSEQKEQVPKAVMPPQTDY